MGLGFALVGLWAATWLQVIPTIVTGLATIFVTCGLLAILRNPCCYESAAALAGGSFGVAMATHYFGWHPYLVWGCAILAAGVLFYALSRELRRQWTEEGPANFRFFNDGH